MLLYDYVVLDRLLSLKYKFDDFEHYGQVIDKLKKGEKQTLQALLKANRNGNYLNAAIMTKIL